MEERWLDEELAGCRLGDGRLDRRLRQLVESMDAGFGESIPLVCQDWASTKAAYRFFFNERVREEQILRGHFDAIQPSSVYRCAGQVTPREPAPAYSLSKWWITPLGRRCQSAMSRTSSTSRVRRWLTMDQPTTRRLKASSTTARNRNPVQVGM